jgi:hypothetical protein
MIRVSHVKHEYLRGIAEDIRDYDANELAIFLGRTPLDALEFMDFHATRAWVLLHNDIPVVYFGYNVTDLLHKVASPFMVATKYAEQHPIVLARYSRTVEDFFAGYYLVNYVQDANAFAIRWLEWMGFYVAERESFQGLAWVRRFSKDCR